MQTILIVDDNPEVRELLSELLKAKGYNILTADNGEDAVKLAGINLPDLMLMDIKMPKKDGITACREIKQGTATRDIPIIMLSSAGQMKEIEEAMKYGAKTYVTKPCDTERIMTLVSDTLTIPQATTWHKAKRGKRR